MRGEGSGLSAKYVRTFLPTARASRGSGDGSVGFIVFIGRSSYDLVSSPRCGRRPRRINIDRKHSYIIRTAISLSSKAGSSQPSPNALCTSPHIVSGQCGAKLFLLGGYLAIPIRCPFFAQALTPHPGHLQRRVARRGSYRRPLGGFYSSLTIVLKG